MSKSGVKKERIFCFIAILYMVILTFPLLADITGLSLPIMCIVVTVICVVLFPAALNNKLFYWILIYFGVLILYGLFGEICVPGIGGGLSVFRTLTIEMAFYLPNVVIISVLMYLHKNEYYKICFITFVVSYLCTFIYCFILLQQDAYILRLNDVISIDDTEKIIGTPSYALMHAFLLLIPTIMYALKKTKGYTHIFMLLILASLVYLVVHTYITTTLLLTFGLLLFFFVYKEKKPALTISISLATFVLLYFLMSNGFFDSILPSLNEFYSGTAVEAKLDDGSAYLGGRESLHQISWESFLSSPLWGYPNVGGHSNLVDRLGGMGLLGFIPYMMIIVSAVKMTLGLLVDKLSKVYYLLCLFCVLFLLYEKGIFNYQGWCFFLVGVPCGMKAIYDNEKNYKQV